MKTCPPHNFKMTKDAYRKPVGTKRVYSRYAKRWETTRTYAKTKHATLYCGYCGATKEISTGAPA